MFIALRAVPFAARIWLSALLLAAASVGSLAADDFNPRDLRHEIMVRDVLSADPRLDPLNIIVRVKDRVATLSGEVPSLELARRAVEKARTVREVKEVRSQLRIGSDDVGFRMPTVVAMPKAPPSGLSPSHSPSPLPSPPPMPTAVGDVRPTGEWVSVPAAPVEQPTHGVALLPWITAPAGAMDQVSRPRETTPNDTADAAAITSAVQSLMQGDERFRRLHFEVKKSKVYIGGAAYRWADVQDLARATTRIPGVEEVVLRDLKTDR